MVVKRAWGQFGVELQLLRTNNELRYFGSEEGAIELPDR